MPRAFDPPAAEPTTYSPTIPPTLAITPAHRPDPGRPYAARHAAPTWTDTATDRATPQGRTSLRRLVATGRSRASTVAALWAVTALGLAWLVCLPGLPAGPVLALTIVALGALILVSAVAGAGIAREGRGVAGRTAAGGQDPGPTTEPLRLLLGG